MIRRTLTAADMRMIDSNIDATALQSLAGNVNLTVDGNIQLTRSVISGESASADAAGGSFSVSKPAALILEQGSLISGSSASAAGGNVTIEADAIVIDPTSNVSASGDLFTIGSVLGSTIQIEDPEAVDASSELATRCTPQQIENRSSLVINTVPPGAVRSPYLTAGPGLVNTPVANALCGGP